MTRAVLWIYLAASFFGTQSAPVYAQEHENAGHPKTLSGDEARQAVIKIVGDGARLDQANLQQKPVESPPIAPPSDTPYLPAPAVTQAPAKTALTPAQPAEKSSREFTDADFGPTPSNEKLQEAIQGIRGADGGIDPEKVQQLQKKVEDAVESSPPEQKQRLKNLWRQIDETVKSVMRQRRE